MWEYMVAVSVGCIQYIQQVPCILTAVDTTATSSSQRDEHHCNIQMHHPPAKASAGVTILHSSRTVVAPNRHMSGSATSRTMPTMAKNVAHTVTQPLAAAEVRAGISQCGMVVKCKAVSKQASSMYYVAACA
jgi:hypothetical protein